jgi:hypothetical protein
MQRLGRRLRCDVVVAARMEEELAGLDPLACEIRLMEYARLDYLDDLDRRLYLRNRVHARDCRWRRPIRTEQKVAGYAFLLACNVGMASQVAYLGGLMGITTVRAWLLSFVVSVLQEAFIYGPAVIAFFHVYLPYHLRDKLVRRFQQLRAEPHMFTTFVPVGKGGIDAADQHSWLTPLAYSGPGQNLRDITSLAGPNIAGFVPKHVALRQGPRLAWRCCTRSGWRAA